MGEINHDFKSTLKKSEFKDKNNEIIENTMKNVESNILNQVNTNGYQMLAKFKKLDRAKDTGINKIEMSTNLNIGEPQ